MYNKLKTFKNEQPRYKIRNPKKYLGDPSNVIYRSTWELHAFKFCDNNPNVSLWASEEIAVEYMKPIFLPSGKMMLKPAKYYPDLYVEYTNKAGVLVKELIEIKPKKQTRASRARNYATNFYENMVYAVNIAKWDAAKQWCSLRGINFCILTEDELFK